MAGFILLSDDINDFSTGYQHFYASLRYSFGKFSYHSEILTIQRQRNTYQIRLKMTDIIWLVLRMLKLQLTGAILHNAPQNSLE